MKLYIFMKKEGQFLCKNPGNDFNKKVYESRTDVDRVFSYRRLKDIERRKKDIHYWEHRKIKIEDYEIKEVEFKIFVKEDFMEMLKELNNEKM